MNKFKLSKYYKSKEHLENAKKGSLLGAERTKELKKERIKKYSEDPKKCKYCEKKFSYEKRSNTFCNTKCSAFYYNKKGSKRKEYIKEKISKKLKENYGNPEFVEKKCPACDKMFLIKWKKRIQKFCNRNCASKRKMSVESKENLSKLMSDKIKNGTFKPKLKSIKCLYKFKDKEIKCDSKVEYSCLNYFETNFSVIDIERCNFLIDFDYNGINKKYNPDFKITTNKGVYVVECKTILSSKELIRKWAYYYDTIEYKKKALDKYCEENNFLSFNYNKSLNNKFYNSCKPKLK